MNHEGLEGSADTERAKGFIEGQAYGLTIATEQLISIKKLFDNLLEQHESGLSEVSKLAWSGGVESERKRLQKMLRDYFELSQEPNEDGHYEGNLEWDRGFQAAMALIANEYNHRKAK